MKKALIATVAAALAIACAPSLTAPPARADDPCGPVQHQQPRLARPCYQYPADLPRVEP